MSAPAQAIDRLPRYVYKRRLSRNPPTFFFSIPLTYAREPGCPVHLRGTRYRLCRSGGARRNSPASDV
jgi:hypothetical protein